METDLRYNIYGKQLIERRKDGGRTACGLGSEKVGYHCPPVQQPYFNTVDLTADIPDSELTAMIDRSYRYVVGKLPRRLRADLGPSSPGETE